MYQLLFTSKSDQYIFMYDQQSIMFVSEVNVYESDSAWMKISKEMRNAYNISHKMNAMTKQFHIQQILNATLLLNGNLAAKFEPTLNIMGEEAFIYNPSNHLIKFEQTTAILFIRFKDIGLSSEEFHIDIEKGLRILTTLDEIDKLNIDQALLDK